MQRLVGDLHMARLAAQTRAVAFRADARVQVFGQFLTHNDGVGFAIATLKVRDYALERMLLYGAAAALAEITEGDLLLAGAVENQLLHRIGEHLPGLLD